MTPIIHKKCGYTIAWYLRNSPREPDYLLSKDYKRLDGTQPIAGAEWDEYCPYCKTSIKSPHEVERVFKK